MLESHYFTTIWKISQIFRPLHKNYSLYSYIFDGVSAIFLPDWSSREPIPSTSLSFLYCIAMDYSASLLPQKHGNSGPVAAACLENLNMTKKMSSNPGLTCAVTWKSCSDCKAAWVSIRLLRCLSVTWDELPGSGRTPVHQVHYNSTAESDYRWQLGTGKHILCSTAAPLDPVLPFIYLEGSQERPLLPWTHNCCTWREAQKN